MTNIIKPVNKELIKKELTPEKFLRYTHALNNSIYVFDAESAPNTMLELGRLRELTFRSAGGGTGAEVDIDDYDKKKNLFKQLIVWNNEKEEIISSYRYCLGYQATIESNGNPDTPLSHLFRFSDEFVKTIWPKCIELGRSFVQPNYQAGNNKRESLFALDNIWDGLGALIVNYPQIEYFAGRMTLYNNYNRTARNLILDFLETHYKGDSALLHPIHPSIDNRIPVTIYKKFTSEEEFKEAFKKLNREILSLDEHIPPLIKTYMSLSPTIQCFGITPNPEFGPVEEISILIKIKDIYEKKVARHVDSYQPQK
ncbi:MAG: GNAT family N-acetyltransferase [Bacteroidales bacterium]|jgi:hypothetical protein|nr:GNAT family N-acetyltransferase [Bacteroidales bacterium]